MLKSHIKALGLVAGLTLSGFACALSLGGINVITALGQPLKLEIALDTASKAETASLSAHLASPEMFKNAGLDYPYGLPPLTFHIETRAGTDEPYLQITSEQAINEPFISLLVEVSWPSGKLLREYTFLLDPPGYVVEQPKVAAVKPVEPDVVVATPQPEPIAEEVAVTPQVTEASGILEETTAEPAVATPTPSPSMDRNVASGPITVKRGDTLYKLASAAKPPEISLERMLVALYRANAAAFDGQNMNRLKAGKILLLPEQAELDNLEQAEAIKIIHAQAADWHAYRQRLAAASRAAPEQAPKQEASGKISATVTDQAPAAKETAKEIVRLSKGEAPGDQTLANGKTKAAQDMREEEAIARKKALQETNDRAAMLEKNIKAMQRLMELKSQSAVSSGKPGADQKASAKTETSALGVLPKTALPASAVGAASAVQSASAVSSAKPVVPPQTSTAQFSVTNVIDTMLDNPLLLRVGAVVLLALLVFFYLWKKRGSGGFALKNNFSLKNIFKRKSKFKEDEGSISGRISTPIVPSPETGDFTRTLVTTTASPPPTDEVDPISEADLFLNFGRDEQAEEILKDALSKNPNNHLIHLKLLSIYVNRKDVNSFSLIANQLKDSGDASAWEQAVSMGRKLDPSNPVYGGGGSSAAAAEKKVEIPTAGTDTVIDLGAVKAKEQAAVLDFDLTQDTPKPSTKTQDTPNQERTIIMKAPMDFDVTGSNTPLAVPSSENSAIKAPQKEAETPPAEKPSLEMEDLVFDITASHATPPVAEEVKAAASPPPAEDIAFSLNFFEDSTPEASATPVISKETPAVSKETIDIGLSEISLNLDEEPAPPAATFTSLLPPTAPATGASGATDSDGTQEEDAATKLDLAKAYQEMGDNEGAREILEEVVREGTEQQRTEAQALLQELAA
ncbi:MAG: FimV/HubP family polar landmark protein [Gallionellaceae bacterium]|nr:FimV/HubP family polar landmark protein [Gallionellaceae bacterium]